MKKRERGERKKEGDGSFFGGERYKSLRVLN